MQQIEQQVLPLRQDKRKSLHGHELFILINAIFVCGIKRAPPQFSAIFVDKSGRGFPLFSFPPPPFPYHLVLFRTQSVENKKNRNKAFKASVEERDAA